MIVFGEFESGREFARGAAVSVLTARRAGEAGPDTYVVKHCRPPAFIGPEEAGEQIRGFLDQAAVQQAVASGAGDHWAPVHDKGELPDGAYYVTDRYELHAGQLIQGLVQLDGRALYTIISSVAAGLDELKTAASRPHGNLKPTNVLIGRSERGVVGRVALCDPLAAARLDPERDWGADLSAVGELLYGLVTHRQYPGVMAWPVEIDAAWTRLGRKARQWCDLCNALLAPADTGESITLDKLAAKLIPLKPPPPWPRWKKVLVGGGAGATVVLLGLLLIVSFNGSQRGVDVPECEVVSAEWHALCDAMHEDNGWLRKFLGRVSADVQQSVLGPQWDKYIEREFDTGGIFVRGGGGEAGSKHIHDHPEDLNSIGQCLASDAIDAMQSIETEIKAWEARGRLVDRWKARTWMRNATAWVNDIASSALPGSGGRYVEVWSTILEINLELVGRIDKAVSEIDDRIDEILEVDDEILQRVVELRPPLTQIPVDSRDDLETLSTRLVETAELLDRILQVDYATLDRQFLAEADVYPIARDEYPLTARIFSMWIEQTSDWAPIDRAVVEQPDWATKIEVLTGLNETYSEICGSDVVVDEVRSFKDQIADIASNTAALVPDRLYTKDLQGVRKRIAGANRDISSLTDQIKAGINRCKQSWGELLAGYNERARDRPYESAKVNDRWNKLATEIVAALLKSVRNNWDLESQVGHDLARLDDLLNDLDQSRSAPIPAKSSIGVDVDIVDSVRRGWRDEILDKILRQLDLSDLLDGIDLDKLWENYDSRVADAKSFLTHIATLEQALKTDTGLDSLGSLYTDCKKILDPTEYEDLWEAVELVVDQYRLVETVSGLDDRVRLRQFVREPDNWSSVVLAAWRRLVWLPPNDPGSIDRDFDIRMAVSRVIDHLRRQGVEAPSDTFEGESTDLWTAYARSARTPMAFDLVADRTGDFGVDLTKVDEPAIGFNLRLRQLGEDLSGLTDDTKCERELDEFVDRELTGSAARLVGVPELLDNLKKISSGQSGPSFADLGPGAVRQGWVARADADNSVVQYTLEGHGHTVTFRRIGESDTYLCTDEMSLALFIDLISTAGAWKACTYVIPTGALDGPRVWEWDQNTTSLIKASSWIRGEPANYYVDVAVAPIPPNGQHPINRVSPAAAIYAASLMGCRLPFVKEWHDAVTDTHGVVADSLEGLATPNLGMAQALQRIGRSWNLRGNDFAAQLAWVNLCRIAAAGTLAVSNYQMPDAKAFWPKGAVSKCPTCRTGVATNRDTLWFFETGSENSSTFLNLIGNVAEYVFATDHAVSFDADVPLDDALKALHGDLKNRSLISVIGGSSVSDPWQIPPWKASPLQIRRPSDGYSDVGFRVAFTATDVRQTCLAAARKQFEPYPPYLLTVAPD